ncbi:hypothetical protein NPX13_g8026 [Xylaria arbuscula]|uniref:Uncharacterized protein n=1 Tax=Xylaria arbuscula TaxID=114810 RepID=A0A9W8TK78_9PEZI|nr:hypothetical protein NPX13_g8026 [Xylaria arbuscula]
MPSSDDLDHKGGRSLRKRARVDYTFEHADEYLSDNSKSTPSAVRTMKRRRTDTAFHDLDREDEFNLAQIKRRSSEQLPPPSSSLRRRNQLRKSTAEPQPILSDQHLEDVEVQDTIEVGGHQSEQSDESSLRRTHSNTSSGLSNDDIKPSQLTTSSESVATPRKSQVGLGRINFELEHSLDGVNHREAPHKSLPDPSKGLVNEAHSSYDHLTPYIDGVFIGWPPAHAEAEPVSELPALQQDVLEDAVDDQFDGAQQDGTKTDVALEDTPMTDPLVPDSTPVDGGMDDTPAMSPLPTYTRANSPTVDADLPYSQPPERRSISFKKTRDASEFTNLLENFKSLPPEEVWSRLAVVNRALVAWQEEYNELRKITEDEDNAVRYRQEDAAYEHRVKMLTSKDPDANPVQKDFIIKGSRAERPHPEIAYARHQDKLMAINYLFDYDDRDSKIGFQEPLEQKPGSGKGRLRDRPKQTAKAAEADDGVVVHGKRVRKPPALFDGSEAASRGSTPIPTQRRRRRAGDIVEENGEVNPTAPSSTTAPSEPQPPKKKGKGGRPRKHPLPVPVPVPEVTPALVEQVQHETEEAEKVAEEKPTRKRRRRKTVVEAGEDEEAPATNGVDQTTPEKAGLRRINSRISEVPSGSFYTSSMQSNNTAEESRPPTSSSTATQSTVTSNNYQLREKRQKKFSLNPEDEVRDEEPKRKRVKRSKKTQVEDFAATPVPVPMPSPLPVQHQPILEPHSTLKPPTKIKLKNYNGPPPVPLPNPFSVPSSSNSTPAQSVNGTNNGAAPAAGTDPADIKDYNQMTKSEKMSHSMKARWASGSMSQAVAKRRATLANKKQAVKAAEPGQPLDATPLMTQS